jgi:hypothetical protein
MPFAFVKGTGKHPVMLFDFVPPAVQLLRVDEAKHQARLLGYLRAEVKRLKKPSGDLDIFFVIDNY